jgi:hypothetical protein
MAFLLDPASVYNPTKQANLPSGAAFGGGYTGPVAGSWSGGYGASAPVAPAPAFGASPSFGGGSRAPAGAAFGGGSNAPAAAAWGGGFRYPGAGGFGGGVLGAGGSSAIPMPGQSSKAPPAPNFENDPNVIRAKAAADAARSNAKSQLRKLRRLAIIRMGDPSLAKAAGIDLSPEDLAAAKANYASGNATMARLDQQNSQARQAIINQLAARGILFSGETGYQEGQQAQAYGNQVYDVRQQLLDYLDQALQQELAAEAQAQEMENSAYQQAYYAYTQNPYLYTGTAPPQSMAQSLLGMIA